ncbi:MAG TPA: DUF748 domain-containing protein [Burkholderiaceae bacterium]|nr:DUF748 domain-containing protein [Burkholderiaceae bacterium]
MSLLHTLPLPAFLGKRTVRRSLTAAGALLFLYMLFGYAILPSLIKSRLEHLSPEKLHRQLTIGAVEVNPFALALTIRDLKLMEPEGNAVFASFDALIINLSTESALRLAPVVQQAVLTKPYVHLARQQAHRYNIDDIIELIGSQPPSPQPARFSVNNIQVEQGRIEFEDKPARATHTITDLQLGVPFISSLPSQVQVFVEPLLSANVNGTPLLVQGKARPFAEPRDAVVEFGLRNLDLTRYLEYLPFKPRIKVSGARLDMQLSVSFRQPKDAAPTVLLNGGATLKSLRISALDGKPILKLPELSVALRDTDVFSGRIEVARLLLNGLDAEVVRERDGQLGVAHLLPAATQASAPAAPSGAAAPRFALGELEIRGASVRYTDQSAPHPMQAGVEKLDLALRKVAIDTSKRTISVGEVMSNSASALLRQDKPSAQTAHVSGAAAGQSAARPYAVSVDRVDIRNWSARIEDRSQPTPTTTIVAPLSLAVGGLSTTSSMPGRMELKAAVNKTGQLALSGSFVLAPFQTDLALNAKGVDLLPLQPYISDKLNLRLTRAALTSNGRLQLNLAQDGTVQGGFRGDMTFGNLATVDKLSGNDFLRWKSLFVGGVDLRLKPLALKMDQVVLSDFFARVMIDPTGRINLQDIMRNTSAGHKSLTEPAAPSTLAANSGTPPAHNAQASPVTPVTIRKLTLQGGRIRFTDNFIKPNYTATLANFGGVVTELSSDAATSAGVDLHGEVNSAPLSVIGRINPLKGDLFLDLSANVRGMELAPLSAYSSRYVGYGIEKGKLSFEVAYHIDKRVLTAENRLMLDQLTFGDKIDSPSATTLPVRFAVALLRDRNGMIDINLPIGGSLDDPQFSVGGLIAKVIVNVITKAITQPFAVIGALFGGGEELSSLALAPGYSAIPAGGAAKLESLSRALADRPALKLEITGRADAEADRAGLKRAAIERKVRILKIKDLQARGETPEPGSVIVNASEYPALLTRAYRDEKFSKPRNLVGMTKSLPVKEMEELMIANTEIGDDDLIALGNQRSLAVKNWLQKNGRIPAERIFILAPKVSTAETKGNDAGGVASGVDFSLR